MSINFEMECPYPDYNWDAFPGEDFYTHKAPKDWPCSCRQTHPGDNGDTQVSLASLMEYVGKLGARVDELERAKEDTNGV